MPRSKWFLALVEALNDSATIRDSISLDSGNWFPGTKEMFQLEHLNTKAARKDIGNHALMVITKLGELLAERHQRPVSATEGLAILGHFVRQANGNTYPLEPTFAALQERFDLTDEEVSELRYLTFGIERGAKLSEVVSSTELGVGEGSLHHLLTDDRAPKLQLILLAEAQSRVSCEPSPEALEDWFDEVHSIVMGRASA